MSSKRKVVLALFIVALAACDRQPVEAPAVKPEAKPARAAPAVPAVPKADKLGASMELKQPLPDGFALPFKYRRLYENAIRTKAGLSERRVMVEFIDIDAPAAQDELTKALAVKGFLAPTRQQADSVDTLVYTRADGASVTAKFDSKPKRVVSPGARGTLHFVWSSAGTQTANPAANPPA